MNVFRKMKLLRIVLSVWDQMEQAVRDYERDRSAKMNIGLKTNLSLQILGLLLQGLNQISAVVPDAYKFWVAVGVGFVQLTTAVVAHFSNPDATPATTAYVPSSQLLK